MTHAAARYAFWREGTSGNFSAPDGDPGSPQKERAWRPTARICAGVPASPNAGMSSDSPNAAPPWATMLTQRSSVSAVDPLHSCRSAGGTSSRVVAAGGPRPAPPSHDFHPPPANAAPQHHEVGALARRDAPDLVLEAQGTSAAQRRELEHLRGGERVGAEARLLDQGGEAHFGEGIEPVVAGGAVRADGHTAPGGEQLGDFRDTAGELQV